MAKSAKRSYFSSVRYCHLLFRSVALWRPTYDRGGIVPKTEGLQGVVTPDEAAEYLRVSKATLLRLANRGAILGVKIGRQWRFSKETIVSLLNDPDWLKKMGSET